MEGNKDKGDETAVQDEAASSGSFSLHRARSNVDELYYQDKLAASEAAIKTSEAAEEAPAEEQEELAPQEPAGEGAVAADEGMSPTEVAGRGGSFSLNVRTATAACGAATASWLFKQETPFVGHEEDSTNNAPTATDGVQAPSTKVSTRKQLQTDEPWASTATASESTPSELSVSKARCIEMQIQKLQSVAVDTIAGDAAAGAAASSVATSSNAAAVALDSALVNLSSALNAATHSAHQPTTLPIAVRLIGTGSIGPKVSPVAASPSPSPPNRRSISPERRLRMEAERNLLLTMRMRNAM